MKRTWKNFAVPSLVSAGLVGLSTSSLVAQDAKEESKETTRTATIVVQAEVDESMIEKVKAALKNSGLSSDVQEKVLKSVRESSKSQTLTLNADAIRMSSEKIKEKIAAQQKRLQDQSKAIELKNAAVGENGSDAAVVVVGQASDGGNTEKSFKLSARVIKGLSENKFKIGVLCSPELTEAKAETPSEGETKVLKGLKVINISPSSPAEKAGIQQEDVLITIDGRPLDSIEQLTSNVQAAGKDQKEISLAIVREGKSIEAKLKPQDMSDVDDVIGALDIVQPGWIVSPGQVDARTIQFRAVPGMPMPPNFAQVFSGTSQAIPFTSNEELKVELEGLRKEISELKELVKELKK